MKYPLLLLTVSLFFFCGETIAQRKAKKAVNPVYIDKQGIMRNSANNQEAAFFGVNYTTPFAYAYRAHKALGVDLENAIRPFCAVGLQCLSRACMGYGDQRYGR
jgi:hypothetical protein